MHVVLLGTFNEQETGPSQVTAGLATALAQAGVEVELLAHGDRTRAPHEDVHLVHMGATPGSVLGFLKLYRRVRKHVKRTDSDVFHALEDYSYGADVRTVQWAHTSLDLLRDRRFPGTNVSPREFVGELPLYAASRMGANKSDYVVAQSPVTERQLNEYWRLSSDCIIPLGVHENTRVQPRPDSEPKRVLFPGRITPKKGQGRVLKHLSPDAGNYQVDIVGSVVDGDYLDDKWTPHCRGFVSRDRLAEFYRDADIVVIPSYHENFSVTALEAVANSCVTVVSRNCGFAQLDEVSARNGIRVFETGEEGARMVRHLAETDSLAEQKRDAFALSKGFTWSGIADQYIEVYEQVR